jgi:hypothetical protein
MKRSLIAMAWIALAMGVAGCAESPGTTRDLGAVSYEMAFVTARDVIGRHYDIAHSDPATGRVETVAKPVEPGPAGVLGGSVRDAREQATLQLRREGERVTARLAVALQRRRSSISRRMTLAEEDYSGVPNKTPAEIDAATTTEQNQTWQTERYLAHRQRALLTEIYRAVHPDGDPAAP